MKSGGPSDELLVALGSKDKQWSVLDDVTVRNLPNGLVSFELVEIFDRFVWGEGQKLSFEAAPFLTDGFNCEQLTRSRRREQREENILY